MLLQAHAIDVALTEVSWLYIEHQGLQLLGGARDHQFSSFQEKKVCFSVDGAAELLENSNLT